MRGQKGVTLVALIITIVVLLILAVVAITAVGDTKIVDYANNAANLWNQSVINENTNMQYWNSQLNAYLNGR